MTSDGGSKWSGTIFKITSTGTYTVLASLNFATMGGFPRGSLVQASDGNFYGLTSGDGTNRYGTLFRMTPSGTVTVLRNFNLLTDGGNPQGSLLRDSDGSFYGMTTTGGSPYYGNNAGTVFKLSSTGAFSVLFRFPDGGTGNKPLGSLIQARDGYFYGMTSKGGVNHNGTVFKLCTDGSFTTVAPLDSATVGSYPTGSLVQGADGYFYGMTTLNYHPSSGTIFKMDPNGTILKLANLWGPQTGSLPKGSLIQAKDGNFYGMASKGGQFGAGTIFKMASNGFITVVKHLDRATTGGHPSGSLVQGSDGNFYGMTTLGGANDYGTIFQLTPTGTFSVLNHLSQTTGGHPQGSLTQATDGNFYGMARDYGTFGTIFKMTSSGVLTVMKNLNGSTTGSYPYGDLVQGTNGVLYGMTSEGGTYKGGTLFQLVPSTGEFKVLRHFNPVTDGGNPWGSLAMQKALLANPQTVTTPQNTAKKVKLTSTGGSPLTYAVATAPLHGTATIVKDSVVYSPTSGYTGADSLYFTVRWGCQTSAPAKVKITVTPTAALTVSNQELMLQAAPNPSPSSFTLLVQSDRPGPATVRVLDGYGRVVETRSGVQPGSTIQIGSTYRNGYYVVEVEQGERRKQLKLVKGGQ